MKISLLLHQSESTRYDHERPNSSSRAARMLVFFRVVHKNCSCGQASQVCFFAFRRSSARTLRRCLVVFTHFADCFDHATILTRRLKKEATVYVRELDVFLTMKLLDDTPAVLSLEKLFDEHGYS